MSEEVPNWKQKMLDAKAKKEMDSKYPDLGKIVKYSGEYGLVILGDYGNNENEEVVRWDTPKEFDNEQYGFFDYEYIDEYEFKYINLDGTLKEEFKNTLKTK